MRRVGLIDITVGNAARFGASQRSTTRRCASHHIATQRASRWDVPVGLARLARTVRLKRLWLRAGHMKRMNSPLGAVIERRHRLERCSKKGGTPRFLSRRGDQCRVLA
jgi:hypothetical protein